MALDHFVSRFLTKPWEVADRKLWYYDFRTGEVDRRPSKELFSEVGLHSGPAGNRLNALVETPISTNRESLAANLPSATIDVTHWKLFQALLLLFPLQPIRLPTTTLPGTLEQVLALSDSEIDLFARHWSSRYRLVRVRGNSHRPLFYPETGYFTLPLSTSAPKQGAAIAIPITLEYAVAMVPAGCDVKGLEMLWTPDFVSGLSVGVQGERVVVPPALLSGRSAKAVGTAVVSERATAVALFSSLGDLQAAIDAFHRVPPRTG